MLIFSETWFEKNKLEKLCNKPTTLANNLFTIQVKIFSNWDRLVSVILLDLDHIYKFSRVKNMKKNHSKNQIISNLVFYDLIWYENSRLCRYHISILFWSILHCFFQSIFLWLWLVDDLWVWSGLVTYHTNDNLKINLIKKEN
jgi:hypothetical protein